MMHQRPALPRHWVTAIVSDIGETVTGNTPPKADDSNYGHHIPFVKPPELVNGVVSDAEDSLSETGIEKARVLPSNSVLVSCIGNLGRTGINSVPVAFNQQINAIIPFEGVEPKFVFYQAQSLLFKNQLEEFSSATTIAIVNKGNFQKITFNLAPHSEQKRIVAMIEELFSELDNGVENLTTARQRLKAYRQAVLKHAFEGKLTADWRASRSNVETGVALRSRVLQMRRKEWENAERARLEQQAASPSNDRWKDRYAESEPFDSEDLSDLPSEWCWAGLDELVSGRPRSMQSGPFGSNLLHSEFQKSGVLVIGIDNVRDGTFSMGSQNRISEAKFQELHKYQARPGDLLVTVMASLGRTCIVPRDLEKAIITKHVYRISMDEDLLYPEYFNLLLQSQTVSRLRMFKNAQGQTRPGLNSSILKALPIPLCSRAEQVEIVSRLSSQLSNIDVMIAEIEDQLSRVTALRHSILKKAFAGRLVAHYANDEPASVLLERIRADKEDSGNGRKENNKNNGKKEAA